MRRKISIGRKKEKAIASRCWLYRGSIVPSVVCTSLHAFDRQAVSLLRQLARARARDRVPWARAAAIAALTRRWTALAALVALRAAHAQSLLELRIRPCDASDGAELPLGELLAEPP